MTFIDETTIKIEGGKGGNGLASYRREKYIEFGGPWGGSGGAGGSVFFVAHSGMNTLYDLRNKKIIKAGNGENGMTKGCKGAQGEDIIVKVPLGTIVYDLLTNEKIGEVVTLTDKLLITKGGKGGLGNIALSNSKNPCPDYAEKGDLGETREVKVVLKVLADVGIIGFPSVGKSSFITSISNARPAIAAYPFTTLTPHLGLIERGEVEFVVADLPGLIKGASTGKGLGISFLKHIERCKMFVHMLDGSDSNIQDNYEALRYELASFNDKLLKRREIIVVNKIDLIDEKRIDEIKTLFPDCLFISIYNRYGLEEVVNKMMEHLNDIIEDDIEEIKPHLFTIDTDDEITIKYEGHKYYVFNRQVKILAERCDFSSYEGLARFVKRLRFMGVYNALMEKGCKTGDMVDIYGHEFDFID
jgi:GTP-binding protein